MRPVIERDREQVVRLDLTGVDFGAFGLDPLPAPVLRCLRYLHDTERHGAIARVLVAHGAPPLPHERRDRRSPLVHTLGSAAAGDSFPTLHMAWGAVDAWTVQAAYARLANRAGHRVLTDVLNRVVRHEASDVTYYAAQAEHRLAGHRGTQRLCRLALEHLWRPAGYDVLPRCEVAFTITELFGDADGRTLARHVDRRIGRLPGLQGLQLVEGAVDRYASAASTGAPADQADQADQVDQVDQASDTQARVSRPLARRPEVRHAHAA